MSRVGWAEGRGERRENNMVCRVGMEVDKALL